MKILNAFLKIVLIIVWSFMLLHLAKFFGFSYDPEEISGDRSMVRVVLGVLILGGAYFIWQIKFFGRKKEEL